MFNSELGKSFRPTTGSYGVCCWITSTRRRKTTAAHSDTSRRHGRGRTSFLVHWFLLSSAQSIDVERHTSSFWNQSFWRMSVLYQAAIHFRFRFCRRPVTWCPEAERSSVAIGGGATKSFELSLSLSPLYLFPCHRYPAARPLGLHQCRLGRSPRTFTRVLTLPPLRPSVLEPNLQPLVIIMFIPKNTHHGNSAISLRHNKGNIAKCKHPEQFP